MMLRRKVKENDNFIKIILYYVGAELLEQATHKVEEIKNQATEVAADAKENVEGKCVHFQRRILSFLLFI